MRRTGTVCAVVIAFCAIAQSETARAIENVLFMRDGQSEAVEGRVAVTAADGGLLLESANGTLWALQPDEILRRSSDSRPFEPMAADDLSRDLLEQLPPGFETYKTAHYVVCYNTSKNYAAWCAALFERLYGAFTNYWSRRGIELEEPRTHLVALVFADEASYQAHAAEELGGASQGIVGYYSLQTNRMTMYDLTGVASLARSNRRRGNSPEINYVLSQPAAVPLVSTIVHEATHQIAFNCGLHTRYADIPLWVGEGLAIYFETPDLSSRKGWKGIGAVNHMRLRQFRADMRRRPPNSLADIIADDRQFRHPQRAVSAYAEAWALNYFLIRQQPKEYIAYLKMLSAKGPLEHDAPAVREAEFKRYFGSDLAQLDTEFLRYMSKVR